MHTIELVQERLNPELEMEGVVFTMYDARTNLSLQVVENVKDSWIRISTKPLFREMSALRSTELRYADQLLRQAVHRCRELPSPGRRSDSQGG